MQPTNSRAVRADRSALRAIAVFEMAKGAAALFAGLSLFGLLQWLHHDLHQLALAMLWRFHLPADARYPALLLHYADWLDALDLHRAAPLVVAYVTLRFAEGYGLWHDRAWAEWQAVLSSTFYMPLEVAHWLHQATWINATVLLANLALVGFLGWRLWSSIALLMLTQSKPLWVQKFWSSAAITARSSRGEISSLQA